MCPRPGPAPLLASLAGTTGSHKRKCASGVCRALGEGREREGEVSVSHWSGAGSLQQPPLHVHTCTPAPQPQSLLAEPAPQTMRLSPLLLLLLGAWTIPGGLGDRAPLTATAPELDDEEKFSAHMPAHLRCDACRVVAYQVSPPPPRRPRAVLLPLPRPPPKPDPSIYLRFHRWPWMPKPRPPPRHRARLSLP